MAAAGALSAGGRRWPRATPHPRSGQRPRMPGCDGAGKAEKSYPTSEARGGGERSHPATEQPHVQGVVAVRVQEGLEEPFHVEGQEGQREEIPLIQGMEQQLCFAGAAMKRYPIPKVRETQVRW